jgi:hypothetical protein
MLLGPFAPLWIVMHRTAPAFAIIAVGFPPAQELSDNGRDGEAQDDPCREQRKLFHTFRTRRLVRGSVGQ